MRWINQIFAKLVSDFFQAVFLVQHRNEEYNCLLHVLCLFVSLYVCLNCLFSLLYTEKDLAESILRVLEADPPSRDKAPPGASGLKLVS